MAGWPPCRGMPRRGGKSGLHGNTVPGNARRGRPQGKCHREQTADRGCFGSWRGKGETGRQERTAGPATVPARQTPPGARPNRDGTPGNRQARFRVAVRVGRVKCPVTGTPEEWSSRPETGGQNPAYRPSDAIFVQVLSKAESDHVWLRPRVPGGQGTRRLKFLEQNRKSVTEFPFSGHLALTTHDFP